MNTSTSYTVAIRCYAYNQKDYIRQCLDGFVMQKTTFRFKAVVHDDASTDGTKEIIQEYADKYPDIILPIFEEENQYSKHDGSLAKIMISNTQDAKYIAFCEGDDFWTDPLMLQKHVDFLENNPSYGMSYSRVRYFYQKSNKYDNKSWGGPHVYFSDLINENVIPSMAVVRKLEVDNMYNNEGHNLKNRWSMGDYPRWLWYSYKSKIHFINETIGVYRVLEESASHSKNIELKEKFIYNTYEIIKYFCHLFHLDNLYDEQKLYQSLFNNAVMYGDFEREKLYYSKIFKRDHRIIIKHFACKNKYLYKMLSSFFKVV